MATTVDIIIKGIAICYRGRTDNQWHVLFPIDAQGCHKIDFSHQKGDAPESGKTPLARSTSIRITALEASSATNESGNFRQRVLNLTSTTLPIQTHPRIRKKGDLAGKAVLLTIPNARFTVRRYLEEFHVGRIDDLEELPSQRRTPLTSLAHSVKATINLNDGGQVIVESDRLPGGRFSTEIGFSYILTFDNDCAVPKADRNDMDMFYDVIEEYDNSTGNPVDRRFRIGGVGRTGGKAPDSETIEKLIGLGFDKGTIEKPTGFGFDSETFKQLIESGLDIGTIKQLIEIISLPTEPPIYEDGKPCLVVQVTEPNDLP